MDAGQLHRLARVLRQAALAATADSEDGPVSAAVVAVVEDLAHHEGTTVSQIASRTGLAQSQVSTTVADLRAGGIATAEIDAADRRRSLLSLAPGATGHVLTSRAARPVDDDVLREVRPETSPEQLARLRALLQELADLLLDDPPSQPKP